MKRSALLVALGLVGCGATDRTAEDFAADPEAAEARRAARMRAYEQAF